jgi:hypothetical protein
MAEPNATEEAAAVRTDEDWRCVICHEDFPVSTAANFGAFGCKHPLCDACFVSQSERRKCDMCNKYWHVEWVPVEHKEPSYEGSMLVVVPTYGGTMPSKQIDCGIFRPNGQRDGQVAPAHRMPHAIRETLIRRFRFLSKRRSPEKIMEKLRAAYSNRQLELYPVSDDESVFLMFDGAARTKIAPEGHYNANAVYVSKTTGRQYALLSASGVKRGGRMKRKARRLSLRAVSVMADVLAKNNIIC